MAKIAKIFAREILNSKAIPTVEATVVLDDGTFGVGSSPTGTSVGKYEALEIRDKNENRFNGMGVLKAIENINKIIAPKLIGTEADLKQVDHKLLDLDPSLNKETLGTNSLLPISIASAKAAATSLKLPLFSYLRTFFPENYQMRIPTPLLNILNGGRHAGNNLDFQEFLIIPSSDKEFTEALNLSVTIYNSLRKTLEMKNVSTLIGDEGGFGPSFSTNKLAFSMLGEAISETKYRINYDVFLGVDAAASNFCDNGKYRIKDKEGNIDAEELISYYDTLSNEFHLLYLEDPLSEEDLDGWGKIEKGLSSKYTIIVGDDLTVTNPKRLQMALKINAISGIIIKPNQIGTILEAIAVIEMARQAGIKIIVSHRSGETNDDFIADFAVAAGADYVKFGAPARGERVAKYNRLLSINNQLKVLRTK